MESANAIDASAARGRGGQNLYDLGVTDHTGSHAQIFFPWPELLNNQMGNQTIQTQGLARERCANLGIYFHPRPDPLLGAIVEMLNRCESASQIRAWPVSGELVLRAIAVQDLLRDRKPDQLPDCFLTCAAQTGPSKNRREIQGGGVGHG
jgi:hypothetical protein